jgi:hypothetical protein
VTGCARTLRSAMKNHPLVLHFISLATTFGAPGHTEYLLWETLEGQRGRPSRFFDPLAKTDLEVCTRLRDELRVWPYWDGGGWDVVPIAEWREHTKGVSANDARQALEKAR